ncbi:MAG: 4Fe-4S binding protein [Defluviitaleaceae bacterium]|nr:4Fe-4S binding protein [Defluviitaleaceae bacterium]
MSLKRVKAHGKSSFQATAGYPSNARIKKGMVAIIECEQEIPCNPCELVCPKNAIKIGLPITNVPVLNEDACGGCGLCIAGCPGQAIFMVDKTFSDKTALAVIPYEYIPQLEKGDTVSVKNRDGEKIGTGVIHRVINNEKTDRTTVLYIEVEKSIAEEVRAVGK